MSLDVSLQTEPGVIADTAMGEARRQVEICNACRYCEGFCSVFPAITRQKVFADGDLTQLANLCHNCRGCYYACQYSEPHEFALNIPAVLADLRAESWEEMAWPGGVARLFQRHGLALAAMLVAAFAAMFWAISVLPGGGRGFYAYLAHGAIVAIFLPAFLLPLAAIAISLRRYWRGVGGGPVTLSDLVAGFASAGRMRNLSGGQGQGCNFEKGDRFTDARRRCHQAVMYGFLLCFASTASGTVMHYLLGWEAPYGFWTPPKLLGVPGGILMVIGVAGLWRLKLKADPALGTLSRWGGEMAFVLLLGFVAFSGLALYWLRDTGATGPMLALHLGSVLAFFLLMPYSKMVHGFFRLAALVREAQIARLAG